MKKIIHFSDSHVGFPQLRERLQLFVESLVRLKDPADAYVVVVTGDLVDHAGSQNYLDAKLQLERLNAAGFKTLVVPGNHDYGSGGNGDRDNVEKFKRMFFGTGDIEYPKLDLIESVAFLGLDSMAEELNWYDQLFAQGELGKRQLDRLDGMLQTEQVVKAKKRVVYFHHHPFDPRPFHELKDADALGEVLRGKSVDAILYGHNHDGNVANGMWGIPRCYDAGSVTRKKDGKARPRVIDFRRDPRQDYVIDLEFEVPALSAESIMPGPQ